MIIHQFSTAAAAVAAADACVSPNMISNNSRKLEMY
jgi:hypothetical protein